MGKTITLKYLNVDNEARIKLGISFLEYGICDMVNKLSTNPKSTIPGWCNQSRENAGYNLGISKTSAVKLVNRMIEKGYLEKNHLGNLRTTSKWYDNVVVKKVHRSGEESSPEAVKKVHPILIEDNNIDKCVDTHTQIDAINPVIDIDFDPCQYIYSTLGKSGQRIRERWMMQYQLDDIDLDEQMEQFSRYYFAKLSEEYGEDNATAQIKRMKLRGLSAKFENSFLRYYKKQA